jgi:formate hydrogenlyase subunit 6/NADH:ubiquinone oxidoreductase subunit I/flavodoxin
MKNRIYFFTGTGNSLKAAQSIANAVSGCELIAICKDTSLEVPADYERVGFVFPNYSGGPPKMVADFLGNMKLPKQGKTYLFAVATYGGMSGNVIAQTAKIISPKGWRLNAGAAIRSYPNAVVFYPMVKGVRLFNIISKGATRRIAKKISAKQDIAIPAFNPSVGERYTSFMSELRNIDNGYNVTKSCVCCGICEKVCPAKNITIDNGKPEFHHQCECCMACIQHCPKRAINYQDKTEKRGRYTNPDIGHQTIIQYYRQEEKR